MLSPQYSSPTFSPRVTEASSLTYRLLPSFRTSSSAFFARLEGPSKSDVGLTSESQGEGCFERSCETSSSKSFKRTSNSLTGGLFNVRRALLGPGKAHSTSAFTHAPQGYVLSHRTFLVLQREQLRLLNSTRDEVTWDV